MSDSIFRSLVLLLAILLLGGTSIAQIVDSSYAHGAGSALAQEMTASQNPLAAKWEGPYGGVPPFDRVQVSLFKPALEAGMAEQLGEIDRIAGNPAAPNFENTIEALERSGRTLNRVQT